MPSVSISASYRKHLAHVAADKQAFEDYGWQVRSPLSTDVVGASRGFVSLRGDQATVGADEFEHVVHTVERQHLEAISVSDMLWLTMPDGYAGKALCLEVGYAIRTRTPVYTRASQWHRCDEPMIRGFVVPVADIRQAVGMSYQAVADIGSTQESTIAVGAVVTYGKEMLLVDDGQWDGQLTIVGKKVGAGEYMRTTLVDAVKRRTGLAGGVAGLISAEDEMPTSHHQGRRFIDWRFPVGSRHLRLPESWRGYWATAAQVEKMPVEPNALRTIHLMLESGLSGKK